MNRSLEYRRWVSLVLIMVMVCTLLPLNRSIAAEDQAEQNHTSFPSTTEQVEQVQSVINNTYEQESVVVSNPTVYLAGDSTVQTYATSKQPQAGWGQMIDRYLDEKVKISNQAIGGRSSRSFIEQGRLDTILNQIQPGDYLMIQFGHNDADTKPERYTPVPDYKVYLKQYIDGARAHGATPILVTPVGRRDFNTTTGQFNISFPNYVTAMKEVATQTNTKLIDLSARSVAYYNSIGAEESKKVFLHVPAGVYPNFPDGVVDNTHFQEYGAIQIARLVAQGIADIQLPLSEHVEHLTVTENTAVASGQRAMEKLNRGLVAVKSKNGIYVGWRMLGLDANNIAFNLYRDGVLVNSQPITGATNVLDAKGTVTSVYTLFTVQNGKETSVSTPVSVWQQQYKSVPLQKPADGVTKDGVAYTYSANDASVGDLDGDGEYEIVLLWSPSNAKDNSQSGYTGIVYLDAYKLNGTRLWRINMGPNIRAGAHYSPFVVYDLDGDGKSEVALRTADGTIDGQGKVIGDAKADYRNSAGYVLTGPEFLTVFKGTTGAALDTINYDPPRGTVASWGDNYGNRVDRFLAGVAYLDGQRPSFVMTRGYYTRTVLVAYDFRDGKITKRWTYDTNVGNQTTYTAQGNHALNVADVDGDGKDEINFGSISIDDNGTPRYTTGLGHGDAQHLGDLNPNRAGLEVFGVHEHKDSPYGMEVHDANTGQVLWGVYTGLDTGRGMSADIDPRFPGEEVWAATITNAQHVPITGLYSITGEVISKNIPSSTNFGIWWDGDLLRELLDDNRIDKWDYMNNTTTNLLTATGSSSNNGTKATPNLQADLYGDWREEVVLRSSDNNELRIYTTTDMTDYRLRTLMHDPVYRLSVAWQNAGYNQPPHPGFHLGVDMKQPPVPDIYYVQ
ncbi:GDSL-type esterase/lipase family protein [Paenibacillus sp. PK4536]|uniref:rhamnogalacturonan lyase family protein n=1 Tax=Paenibacillus sp. PK4536 TaxID=3024576 RepID=UPI00235896A8|nr:SGNH/GDSL hydrolase family protein [Paenibacillus sp. PK4536]WIM41170.1 GDSL-type esterase/lipase family protein [Paenibacillus sp. PK4536]